MNSVIVCITCIFSSGRVGLAGVHDSVKVHIFITVIKGVSVRVVVTGVACLGRVTVGTVDFNTVVDTVVVGICCGWVSEQGKSFVGIIETITIGVGSLWAGGSDAVDFCSVGSTSSGANPLNGVTRRGCFSHNTVGSISKTGGRATHGRPCWVDEFHEVDQSVVIRVAVRTIVS